MHIPAVDRSLALPPAGEITPVPAVTGVAPAGGAAARPGAAPTPTQTTDYVGQAQGGRGPDTPSVPSSETPNRDWTEVRRPETAKPPEEPPKEPLYKLLMEHVQSLWRASAQVADIAEEAHRQALRSEGAGTDARQQAPIVYSDPARVKRSPPTSDTSAS